MLYMCVGMIMKKGMENYIIGSNIGFLILITFVATWHVTE